MNEVNMRLLLILLMFCACAGSSEQYNVYMQTHYEKGVQAMARKEYITAEKELTLVLKKNNRYISAYSALGDVYFHWGRLDESQRSYEKALALDANYVPALIGMAKLRLQKNDTKEAIAILNNIFQITSTNAESCFLMGEIYSKEQNTNLAIEFYKKALNLNPNHPDAQLRLKEAQQQNFVASFENIDLSKKETVTREEMAYFIIHYLDIKPRPIFHEIPIFDVSGNDAEKEIRQVVHLQLMPVTQNMFQPKRLITKSDLAEIAQALLIWHTGDVSLKNSFAKISTPFVDVFPADSYYNAVILANSYGLLDAAADRKFQPSLKVTGNEALLFLDNVKKILGN